MKPIKLTMKAFGPYKSEEVIDFNELKDNRLFVISGSTGAGKTTIFDGICFALYGFGSGQDRKETKRYEAILQRMQFIPQLNYCLKSMERPTGFYVSSPM